ncbi:MAG: flagellar motor switch protein FliM [bacterium]
MADQLSQAEIDALLDTFVATSPDVKSPRAAVKTESYDFSHPDLLSRDQVRALRTLHEGFAQVLAKRLSTEFLTNVSAAVVSIDHLTYAEFLVLVPSPTVLAVVEIPELEGAVAIELNPSIAFAFIDRLLGGEGKPMGKARALTAIEQGLMQRVLQKCCQELSTVWAPVKRLEFRLQSIEGNPELARVVGPSEMAILISLELRMNDLSGMLNLCLPYVVMEPAVQALGQGSTLPRKAQEASGGVRRDLEQAVGSAATLLDVDLGRADLDLAEILALEPGDVLRWTPAGPTGAVGSFEGVPRLDGEPGRAGGRVAFRVTGAHAGHVARKEE